MSIVISEYCDNIPNDEEESVIKVIIKIMLLIEKYKSRRLQDK